MIAAGRGRRLKNKELHVGQVLEYEFEEYDIYTREKWRRS